MSEPSIDLGTLAEGRVGTTLHGKYRLERVLGVGGMAAVYLGTHRNRQRFAIKMLHRELSLRSDVRARFLREGYVANSVGHRGAVKVIDDDVADDGVAFLVMELLEGTGVEQLWESAGHRLSERAVLCIAEQLLDVLAAAHANGIVHRDIKPANLFLTHEGVVKVLDFGIARLRDSASSHATHTGMLLGTPAFMSPEQALGLTDIDGLTDVWAVGATMFSLLCGDTVHTGDNAQQIMIRAATQPSRSLSSVVPGASPSLVAIVDRALAHDRAARWPNAASMRHAIRELHAAMHAQAPSSQFLTTLFSGHPAAPIERSGALPAVSTGPALDPTAAAAPVPAKSGRVSAVGPSSPGSGAHTTSAPLAHQTDEPIEVPRTRWARTVAIAALAIAVVGTGAGMFVLRGPKPPPTPAAPSLATTDVPLVSPSASASASVGAAASSVSLIPAPSFPTLAFSDFPPARPSLVGTPPATPARAAVASPSSRPVASAPPSPPAAPAKPAPAPHDYGL